MVFLSNLIGTQMMSPGGRQVISRYMLLDYVGMAVMMLSNTFYILFVIDHIGFTQASFIVSLTMFVQLLIDYPSGSLGDWIGQRWVLSIANLSYMVMYYLLFFTDNSITSFMIIAIISGFANAMASGALQTWLDNSYKQVAGNTDPERKIYGFSIARITSLRRLVLALAVILGGFLATQVSRRFVFLLQGFLLLFYTFLIIFLVSKEKITRTDQFSLRNYLKFLRGGLRFTISSKATSFFIFGLAIYSVTWLIWANLIQLPLYFGYTGSDDLSGILRSSLLLVGIPISMYTASITQQFSNSKYPLIIFLHVVLFFPLLFLLLTLLPINNKFDIVGILSVFLIQVSLTSTLFWMAETLRQRVMIDMIPSEHRNAVYSLIPTLVSLFGIPVIMIAGVFTDSFGLPGGITIAFFISMIGIFLIFLSFKFAGYQRPFPEPKINDFQD
ncbi:MAG: MFS transporter [Promethearchaeota archaeon]